MKRSFENSKPSNLNPVNSVSPQPHRFRVEEIRVLDVGFKAEGLGMSGLRPRRLGLRVCGLLLLGVSGFGFRG